MAVLRKYRTYPLSFISAQTGLVAAFDFAGNVASSNAQGFGVDHSGNSHPWPVAPSTTPSVITIDSSTGMYGLDLSVAGAQSNNFYGALGLAQLGLNVGTGDYSIWIRLRVPTAAPTANLNQQILRLRDTDGTDKFAVGLIDVTSTGKWHVMGITSVDLNWSDSSGTAPGGIVDIVVTRTSGTKKWYIDGVLKKTTVSDTTDFKTANGASNSNCFLGQSSSARQAVWIDMQMWTIGMDATAVSNLVADPYARYTNTAPSNTITISSPTASSTVGTNINISGTYSGSTPTGIEASFNGSAYTALTSVTISGGTYSGTLSGTSSGTGTLSVRWANDTSATASVASITVAPLAIAISPPAIGASADSYARSYRIFQRDGSNQASVRIAGTYTGGTPTNIEYQWNGGSWTTLVSGPTGGTFDATVTLSGPGQGDLNVRWSNNTAVTATIPAVGVGDVFMVGGQSNNVGMSVSSQVAPVAPVGNTNWVASEFSKANTWRANVETLAQPFDDRTSSAYAAYTATTVYGSYFGKLATLFMARGVPVAFVPCAMGSTSIADWQPGAGGANALYDTMVARATIVNGHKAVIWWQGEQDVNVSTSQSTYTSSLNTVINSWYTAKGTPWIVLNINNQGIGDTSAVRAAILSVAKTNTHVLAYADMLGLWTDGNVHYGTTAAINAIATAVDAGLYNAPVVTAQPTNQAATPGATATFTAVFTASDITTYQWYRSTNSGTSWSAISGATTTSYTTPATTISGGSANNGDMYKCTAISSGGTTNTNAVTLTVATAATAITISGPSTGYVGAASSTFTVSANGPLSSNVIVTPSDSGGGGSFSPSTVTLTSGSISGTFTYTPSSSGSKSLSVTNNGSLSNPAAITYTVSSATLIRPILFMIDRNTGAISFAIPGN